MISKTKPKPESTVHITVSILKGFGVNVKITGVGAGVVELGTKNYKSEKYKCL